jgi:hypothetical protein
MKKTYYIAIAILIVLALIILGVFNRAPREALGSVNTFNEYHSSTTRNYIGTAMPNLSVLVNGPGALGSVVITGAGAGYINLFDATSTKTNTEWGTTTIASIPISAVAGTYTFDVSFQKGLLVEIIGTTPTSTITFRP